MYQGENQLMRVYVTSGITQKYLLKNLWYFHDLADIGQRYAFRLHVFEKARTFYNKELSMESSSTCLMHSKL